VLRPTFVGAGLAAVLALTAPLASAPVPRAASVVLRPPNLWSFKLSLLRNARQQLGTAGIVLPLP